MTIKRIGTLFKKHELKVKRPLNYFSGNAIAFDGNNIMMTRFKTAYETIVEKINPFVDDIIPFEVSKEFVMELMKFFNQLIEAGITPVIVYDGAYPEAKKEYAHKRSSETRAKSQKEYNALKEKFMNNGFSITGKEIDKYRKLSTSLSYPDPKQVELYKNIVKNLGFKVYQSNGDGERLACTLVRSGICKAVWSQDYDCLVHGAHTVILGLKGYSYQDNERVTMVETISLKQVLKALDISFQQYVEMCIISGCDYNDNIPRYGVGTVYKDIKKYGSYFEIHHKVIKTKGWDASILNFPIAMREFVSKEVTELLTQEEWEDYDDPEEGDTEVEIDPPNINKNLLSTCRKILELYSASGQLDDIVHGYKNLPPINMYERDKRFIYEGSKLPLRRRVCV